MPRKVQFHSIKVNSTLFKKVRALLGDVRKKGWKHVSSSRNDKATVSNLIDEAVTRLQSKGG